MWFDTIPDEKRACGLCTYDGKGKCEVVTLRQEGYKDDRVKAVLILNLGTRMTWVVRFTPGAPYHRGKSPGTYRIESWNFVYLVRNEPRIVQTLAVSLHQLCYPVCLDRYLIIDPPSIFHVIPSPTCSARIYCTLRTNFGNSLRKVLEDCEAQNLSQWLFFCHLHVTSDSCHSEASRHLLHFSHTVVEYKCINTYKIVVWLDLIVYCS